MIVMRKGEMPVGHIVAIVLGIAVIGLIGWWLFKNYFSGTKVGNESECFARKLFYCTNQNNEDAKAKALEACGTKEDISPKACLQIVPRQEEKKQS